MRHVYGTHVSRHMHDLGVLLLLVVNKNHCVDCTLCTFNAGMVWVLTQ